MFGRTFLTAAFVAAISTTAGAIERTPASDARVLAAIEAYAAANARAERALRFCDRLRMRLVVPEARPEHDRYVARVCEPDPLREYKVPALAMLSTMFALMVVEVRGRRHRGKAARRAAS